MCECDVWRGNYVEEHEYEHDHNDGDDMMMILIMNTMRAGKMFKLDTCERRNVGLPIRILGRGGKSNPTIIKEYVNFFL
jgi:hypothetical protein